MTLKIAYTYWRGKDGFLLGYLNDWPEHWTQGKDIPELEEMLLDLYEIVKSMINIFSQKPEEPIRCPAIQR
jgi:predicted RNase H-like HicB family nuclease